MIPQRDRTPRRATSEAAPIRPLVVIVPMLPPTINHAYRPNGRGGKLLTDEHITFRQEVALAVRGCGWHMPAGRLQLTMLLTFGTKRARVDIDNRIKTGLDALALALGFDDSLVDRIVIERVGVDPKRPLCKLILEERGGDVADVEGL